MTYNVNRYTAPNPEFEDTMSIAHGLPYLEILKGSGTQELTFLPSSRKWGMNCKLAICQSKMYILNSSGFCFHNIIIRH